MTRNQQTKNTGDSLPTVHLMKNKSLTFTQHGNEETGKKKSVKPQLSTFAGNQIGHWNTFVQHGKHIAITARKWDTSPKYANPKQTDSWPETDHIQYVNRINRIDFYKTILLDQGKPI